MKQKHDILEQLGKDPGFKVPQGYFEGFTEKMIDKLPEITITDVEKPTSLWVKVRPFVYMAAMFVGVFCMITMFKMINNPAADQRKAEAEMNSLLDKPASKASDPSILNYEDSVNNNLQAPPVSK
ncbi:MAG: hypothetical protein IJ835_08220 [Muribaculaceae bacterium]|nr:hypothetical protein [Muribaculaceae bacterium]